MTEDHPAPTSTKLSYAERERIRKREFARNNPEIVKRWEDAGIERNGKRKRVRPPPEKNLEYQRRYKAKAGPEWRRAESIKRAKLDKLNPEGRRVRGRNRAARKKAALGSHTATDIQRIYILQKGKCATCRIKVSFEKKQVDHIEPLARGGSNYPTNLQILCPPCNLRKGSKDPIDWAKQNGMLV